MCSLHSLSITLTFLREADRDREKKGVWYPPRRFFSPRSLFLFLNPPFLHSFHCRTQTHLFTLHPPPPFFLWRTRSIAVHVGKLLGRYSHCFFFFFTPWFRELSTLTTVERMSARKKEEKRDWGGGRKRCKGGREMLRLRSLLRAEGVMVCLFLCARANVTTTAARGGDGEGHGHG